MTMNTAQRFQCLARDCAAERFLPESPTDGKRRVRAGCEHCGTITQHGAVGRVGGTI